MHNQFFVLPLSPFKGEGKGRRFVIYIFLGIIGRKEFGEKECEISVAIILYAVRCL